MDLRRPSSSANSTTTTSHKRAPSGKAVPPPSGLTVLSLLVRNLRLLDLDLLPDWPDITRSTFSSSQDARTRIRCAEWSLYQLFRIYDPPTTAEKLQPFFPPLEPLQSINLRAALYRCLNELKKNGMLGRETVLRKSMLDDCQGDKFWELCLSFSATVLRKVNVDNHNKYGRPVAERIGNAQSLSKSQRDSMLPLAIAHKAALTRVLSEKERKRRTYARLYDVLVDKENDLQDRKARVKERSRYRPQKAPVAQEVLSKNWVGSNEVRDALENGDDAAGGDSVLTRSFDSVWQANAQDRLFSRDSRAIGILEDLEIRARNQKRRLQKWQSFHERLLSCKPPPSRDSGSSSDGTKLSFDKHQNLTLRDMAQDPAPPPSPIKHEKHDSVTKYDEILTAMREELRKNAAPGRPPAPEPESTPRPRPQSYRKPSVTQDSNSEMNEQHHRSHSVTAVPMRPPSGMRISSRSRSYQAPKIMSMREPIQLKSEIFSPLKTKRNSISPAPAGSRKNSMLASPIEEPSPTAQIEDIVSVATHRMRQSADFDQQPDTGVGVSSRSTPTRDSGASTPRSTRSGSENPDSAIELPSKISSLGVAGRSIDGYGRTMRPSLADRTRMSMAFKSTDDVPLASEAHANTSNRATPDLADDIPLHDPSQPSLHDRTRQSMSLAPTAPLQSKKHTAHARSRTAAYPINQFETPQKVAPRRSTVVSSSLEVNSPAEDGRRSITPREKLFEQGAEYSSIFKPRPKVALSPVVSPYVDSPLGGEEEEEDGEMSPTARRTVV